MLKNFSRTVLVCILTGISVGLVLLHGCAGWGRRLEAPRISLVDIQVLKATLFEATFKIELRVYNTNEVPITLKGADCRLKLQGKEVATGVSDEAIAIPALGTGVVSMTVYSSVLEIIKGLLASSKNEGLDYAVSGRVFLGGGTLIPPFLPFQSEGRLDLKDFVTSR